MRAQRGILACISALVVLWALPVSAEAASRDRDHDRLIDRYEVKRSHTNPRKPDTDRDALRDGFEVRRSHTNPRAKDTDGDGLTDGYEVKQSNTSALRTDTDRDGTSDGMELLVGTNPRERGREEAPRSPTPAAPSPDLLPPETQIDSGPSGTVASGAANFTFSSSETSSTFACRLDAGAWASCTSPKAYSSLGNGSHTFDVRATDAGGNTDGSPATRTWTVAVPPPDTTAPDTTISGGPSGMATSGSASFTFTASETGSTFACRIDAGAWASCTSPKAYSGLGNGSHTFDVRATDAAGNTDGSPATRTWTVALPPQPEAPTASFSWSPQNPQNPPVAVTFTSTGTCPATPCTYEWRHGPPGNAAIGTGQTAGWTYQSTGSKTVVLRVTDSLGRFAEASNTFTVSNSAPPPPPPDADGDGVPDSSDQCPNTPAGTAVDSTGCPTTTPPPGGGFPGASNTGVPAGTVLSASGGMTINTAGTVIDAREITGQVVVNAPNVTIRRSRIRSNSMWVVDNNSSGLVIEDSEIMNRPVAGQNNCHNAIGDANFTVRRTELTGCENAANVGGDNVTFVDSWMHDLDTSGPSYVWGNEPHTDGLQMSAGADNIVVRHNTIDPVPRRRRDGADHHGRERVAAERLDRGQLHRRQRRRLRHLRQPPALDQRPHQPQPHAQGLRLHRLRQLGNTVPNSTTTATPPPTTPTPQTTAPAAAAPTRQRKRSTPPGPFVRQSGFRGAA